MAATCKLQPKGNVGLKVSTAAPGPECFECLSLLGKEEVFRAQGAELKKSKLVALPCRAAPDDSTEGDLLQVPIGLFQRSGKAMESRDSKHSMTFQSPFLWVAVKELKLSYHNGYIYSK